MNLYTLYLQMVHYLCFLFWEFFIIIIHKTRIYKYIANKAPKAKGGWLPHKDLENAYTTEYTLDYNKITRYQSAISIVSRIKAHPYYKKVPYNVKVYLRYNYNFNNIPSESEVIFLFSIKINSQPDDILIIYEAIRSFYAFTIVCANAKVLSVIINGGTNME